MHLSLNNCVLPTGFITLFWTCCAVQLCGFGETSLRLISAAPHHYRHHRNLLHSTNSPFEHSGSLKSESSGDNSKAPLKTDQTAAAVRVPTYFKLLYENLLNFDDDERDNWSGHSGSTDTIVRAIVPTRITRTVEGSKIEYRIMRENLGRESGFLQVQFILTLNTAIQRDLLALELSVRINGMSNALNGTVVMESRPFYSLPLTGLLHNAGDAAEVELNVEIKPIFLDGATDRFGDYFDVMEPPFLLIQFRDLPGLSFGRRARRSVLDQDQRKSPHSLPSSFVQLESNGLATDTGAEHQTSASRSGHEEIHPEYDVESGKSWKTTTTTTESSKYCQRRSWVVDPKDVGWNTVISSEKLDLGYCAGGCPYPLLNEHFNYTRHAFFLDRLRLMKSFTELPKEFPRPCCVPVTYKKLKVMEQEGKNFVLKEYSEAAVDSCGCR